MGLAEQPLEFCNPCLVLRTASLSSKLILLTSRLVMPSSYNIWRKQIILDICINIFRSPHLFSSRIQRNIEQVQLFDCYSVKMKLYYLPHPSPCHNQRRYYNILNSVIRIGKKRISLKVVRTYLRGPSGVLTGCSGVFALFAHLCVQLFVPQHPPHG